jgi:hypothetical protein
VEAICAQIVTHFGFPCRVSGRLLHDNPFWRQLSGDTSHLGPKGSAIAFPVDGGANTGTLAWRPSNEETGATWNGAECTHVVVRRHARELALDEPASLLIKLNELDCVHTGQVQAERVAADATKEVEDAHIRLLSVPLR